MHGRAFVRFAARDGRTALADLHQSSPLRVLFPLPADKDPKTAALVTTSGGLVGGDSLAVGFAVEGKARAMLLAQAAEKVYRSAGPDGTIDIALSAGPDARLEYLPQETILFEGARLRRRTRIDLAAGARVLAGEILVFGRLARGEQMTHGLVREAWEIRRDGRLIWADALHLEGDIRARLVRPAGFLGAHGLASLVLVADDAQKYLSILRNIPETPDVRAGATIVNSVLIARWLAADPLALRRAFARGFAELRAVAMGSPKTLPRLWHV